MLRNVYRSVALGVAWLCLGACGCAASRPSPLNYSVRHVETVERDPLIEAARAALEQEGYTVDSANALAGVVTTRPLDTSAQGDKARIGYASSWRHGQRRVAQVRLAPGADAVNLYCKVVVQEQTTEAYRLFRQERALSDIPGETAIDREGATTVQQNTVWRTVRRDKAAERRILDAILENVRR